MEESKQQKFIALSKKVYPDETLRNETEKACRLIVASEKYMLAKKEFDDAQRELQRFAERNRPVFPGSHLGWKNNIIKENLRNLVNITFPE